MTPEWRGRHSDDATLDIIAQLEQSLASSPTQQQQNSSTSGGGSSRNGSNKEQEKQRGWFGWFSK